MVPLICFSYALAPPGVYFEKVPLPFSADKMGRRLQLVSSRRAAQTFLLLPFPLIPSHLLRFQILMTNFLEVEYCFCLFCFAYLTQWSVLFSVALFVLQPVLFLLYLKFKPCITCLLHHHFPLPSWSPGNLVVLTKVRRPDSGQVREISKSYSLCWCQPMLCLY